MLRLTGGEFRGRMIHTPSNLRTRPTQARLRQALFNSVQTLISDAQVLDLFAGSGALGFEALSRGASEAVMVEGSKSVIRLIEKNVELLDVKDRVRIISDSVDDAWDQVLKFAPYDLVLADPPYQEGWEMRLLNDAPWLKLLKPEGRFCLEWGSQKSQVSELPDELPFLVKVREKNYGDSVLTTYCRRGDHES